MEKNREKAMQNLGGAMERLGQALEAQKYAEALVRYLTGERTQTGTRLDLEAQYLARGLRENTDNLFTYFNGVLEEAKASGASPELLKLVEGAATKRDGLALLGGFTRSFDFVRMVPR
jgi:hypothetical protein